MRSEDILDALGSIDDDLIEQVNVLRESKRKRGRRWILQTAVAVAACFCLVAVGVKVWDSFRLGGNPGNFGTANGAGDGETYDCYTGPVFPLSTLEECPGLSAERTIDFDFSPYKTKVENIDGEKWEQYDSKSIITDEYQVKNSSPEEKTVTFLYPVAGSLDNEPEGNPVVRIDGKEAEAELHIGPCPVEISGAGEDLEELNSWKEYKALVESGYQGMAFDAFPVLAKRVIVYELSQMHGEESEDAPAPALNLEFRTDFKHTQLFTYNFNGEENDYDSGKCSRGIFISQDESGKDEKAYLIVLGEDIKEPVLQGYTDMGFEKKMEQAGGTLKRYECSLDEIFSNIVKEDLAKEKGWKNSDFSDIPIETFISLAAEQLDGEIGIFRKNADGEYYNGSLEELFMNVYSCSRIMYLTFDVKLPGEGSVTITASMRREASTDSAGSIEQRNAYDMVTRLGSVLDFTGQSASITNAEYIEITKQNFGFDPEKGITKVTLDLKKEHYFMEVQKKLQR